MTDQLKFPFIRNEFTHELVRRDCLVCLVKRSKGEHWHYEVVKLRIRPAEELFGKLYPQREIYPATEEWGTYGFTYLSSDLKGVEKRYGKLVRGGSKPSGG